MKRSLFIGLAVLVVIPFSFVSAAEPPEPSQLQPLDNIDIWVSPSGWHHFWWTDLDRDDTIYFDFKVTEGGSIDFFFCDQATWNTWSSGGSGQGNMGATNVGSASGAFAVPYSGTWHLVFSNTNLLLSTRVEGYVGLIPQWLSLGMVAVVLLVVILVFGGTAACAYKHKPSLGSPVRHHPDEPSDRFCSECGAFLES
ncbi:MAG: hypothetical protein ACE5H4_15145 [Candidatus Thorarchaeota archaeon]